MAFYPLVSRRDCSFTPNFAKLSCLTKTVFERMCETLPSMFVHLSLELMEYYVTAILWARLLDTKLKYGQVRLSEKEAEYHKYFADNLLNIPEPLYDFVQWLGTIVDQRRDYLLYLHDHSLPISVAGGKGGYHAAKIDAENHNLFEEVPSLGVVGDTIMALAGANKSEPNFPFLPDGTSASRNLLGYVQSSTGISEEIRQFLHSISVTEHEFAETISDTRFNVDIIEYVSRTIHSSSTFIMYNLVVTQSDESDICGSEIQLIETHPVISAERAGYEDNCSDQNTRSGNYEPGIQFIETHPVSTDEEVDEGNYVDQNQLILGGTEIHNPFETHPVSTDQEDNEDACIDQNQTFQLVIDGSEIQLIETHPVISAERGYEDDCSDQSTRSENYEPVMQFIENEEVDEGTYVDQNQLILDGTEIHNPFETHPVCTDHEDNEDACIDQNQIFQSVIDGSEIQIIEIHAVGSTDQEESQTTRQSVFKGSEICDLTETQLPVVADQRDDEDTRLNQNPNQQSWTQLEVQPSFVLVFPPELIRSSYVAGFQLYKEGISGSHANWCCVQADETNAWSIPREWIENRNDRRKRPVNYVPIFDASPRSQEAEMDALCDEYLFRSFGAHTWFLL